MRLTRPPRPLKPASTTSSESSASACRRHASSSSASLPSDVSPEKTAADQAVNKYLSVRYGKNTGRNAHLGINQDPRVTFLDISSTFAADGKLNTAIFYDPRLPDPGKPVHPDTIGQRRMAEAIEPMLAKLMGDKPRTSTTQQPTPQIP